MLDTFEDYTMPLNDYEREFLLPKMIKGLQHHVGKDKTITNAKMREGLERQGLEVGDARIRKLISHIRIHGLVERLIATGKGYYVTNCVEELERYILSLRKRVAAIQAIIMALVEQLERYKRKLQGSGSQSES